MGNACIPGYYKLAEVDDLEHILPHVFSEEEDGEAPVSSRKTLLLQSRIETGKKSRIQLQSSRYRSSTSTPEMRSRKSRERSTKPRRRPLKKRSRMHSSRNTESYIDFRAVKSLISNKSPIVLAFLASDTNVHVKHRNTRSPLDISFRCKKTSRVHANEFDYGQRYGSHRNQDSKRDSNPCIKYCRSCKINAFPCADYCRECYKSVSRSASKPSYHRYHPSTARISPSSYIKISD